MLSDELQLLLQSLRQRIRRYVVLDSLLAIAAVLLSAFWIGLAIDYFPVILGGSEMPRSARAVLLVVVGVVVSGIAITMLFARLYRPLPDDSLALLVERVHPKLGGRLITTVQLTRPHRQGDVHSPELLRMVHDETNETLNEVDPSKVFRTQPLMQKAMIAGPLLLLMLGFAFFSPGSFARAAARLTLFSDSRWPRRAHLEMVGVDLPTISADAVEGQEPVRLEFDEQTMRLPKGSSATLRIRAAADDAEVPSLCTVLYETSDGTTGQSNMRRVGRERDGYQAFILDGPPLSNLSDSFTFTVRGLDDRLTDYRIEAVEPPTITEMNVRVRYPDYLRKRSTVGDAATDVQFDLETTYKAGLRISEGSDITLQADSSLPLGSVDAVLETDGEVTRVERLEFGDDRKTVSVRLRGFRKPTAIRLVPSDENGIGAQAPFRYFLGAIIDEPPSVNMKLVGIQTAVTPSARLPIACETKDDYSVESLVCFVRSRSPQADDEARRRGGA